MNLHRMPENVPHHDKCPDDQGQIKEKCRSGRLLARPLFGSQQGQREGYEIDQGAAPKQSGCSLREP